MKRYFLLLFLLQISSNQLFANLKDVFTKIFTSDKLIYGICAVPLAIDLSSKIYNNKTTPGTDWDHNINTQVASGIVTSLCYFGLLCGIKNKKIPRNLSLAGLLFIPTMINPLAKYIKNENTDKDLGYFKHIGRGIASGAISGVLHGALTVYYYKKII